MIFDLRTQAADTEVRNLMFMTTLDERLVIVSFSCTRELEGEWWPHAQRVIDSIELVD